ncbi:MAG: hypothetical protein ABJB10_07995 [Mesorhizobium sp.]
MKSQAIAAIVNGALSARGALVPATASLGVSPFSEIPRENSQMDGYRSLKKIDGI